MVILSNRLLQKPLKTIRKIVVFLVGGTILLIGVIMLVTPGPAVLVIPAGLGILAMEFAWARGLLKKAKALFVKPTADTKPGNTEPPHS